MGGCASSAAGLGQNLTQSPQGGMNGTQQGAAGGAGAGALVGGLIGGLVGNANDDGQGVSEGLKGGAIGAIVGGLAGGAIGAFAGNKYLNKEDVNTPAGRLFNFMQGKGGAPEGSVAWTEFSQMTSSVGWDQAVATQMWYETDKDRSGVLSMTEWLEFARKPETAPHIERLADQWAPIPQVPGARIFVQMQGKSGAPPGSVSWVEFSQMTSQVGWDQGAATQMWQTTDKDRSGVLSEPEFLAFAAQPGVTEYIERMEASLGAPAGAPAVAPAPIAANVVPAVVVPAPAAVIAPPPAAPVAVPAPVAPVAPVAAGPGAKLFAANQGQGGAPAGAIAWTNFSALTAQVGWQQDAATQMWYDADKDRSGILNEAEFMAFAAKPGVAEYIVQMEANMP